MAVPSFVDRVQLHVAAGRGGNGVASVHREKFKPLGGPDGGNGGPGGSVLLRVDPDVTTLLDYHRGSRRRAEHGGHGAGAHRNGTHGADLVLPVPDGTVVRRADGSVLGDLVGAGSEMVLAQGGRGGLGNAALASSKRKAPGFALLGEPGDELDVQLRAQGRRGHRPGRLPERRQVQPDRGPEPGPAEDRRLPVHHAGAQPRGGPGR